MSTSSSPADPAGTDEALAADLIRIRDSLMTPEMVGRMLSYHVLTEAVTQGNRIDADTFELPMTVTTTVLRPESDDKTATHTITAEHVIHIGPLTIAWHSTHTRTVTAPHGSGITLPAVISQ